jgi:cell wall-associated NlpC family hydrolase
MMSLASYQTFLNEQENLLRQSIVDEAMTWLRTPWRHASMVKGAGVDCGQLLIAVYAECGFIARYTPDYYPQDFAQHSSEERFLANIERYSSRVELPKKGDIVVWKYGRCFSHAAIVVDFPVIIHAKIDEGVLLDDGLQGDLYGREHRFYSVITDYKSPTAPSRCSPPFPKGEALKKGGLFPSLKNQQDYSPL